MCTAHSIHSLLFGIPFQCRCLILYQAMPAAGYHLHMPDPLGDEACQRMRFRKLNSKAEFSGQPGCSCWPAELLTLALPTSVHACTQT